MASGASKSSICVNNTYKITSNYSYHGFKTFDDKAYNRFVMIISKDDFVEFEIISCQMSTHDFEFPIEELNNPIIVPCLINVGSAQYTSDNFNGLFKK